MRLILTAAAATALTATGCNATQGENTGSATAPEPGVGTEAAEAGARRPQAPAADPARPVPSPDEVTESPRPAPDPTIDPVTGKPLLPAPQRSDAPPAPGRDG